MALDDELLRLRTSSVVAPGDHVVPLRVAGPHAFEVLDRATSAPLKLYDAQARLSLLLGEDGLPRADLLVARSDEEYLVLGEGLSAPDLSDAILAAKGPGEEVTVERLDETHGVLEVHGPWSWELLGELVNVEVVSIPYLTFYGIADDVTCFRSGKTGEYGYELLAPKATIASLRARLLEGGAELDVGEASLATLDHAALENWFFCVREEGRAGLGPLELGLSWRLSRKKDFVGSRALAARRAAGAVPRITCALGDGEARPGDPVLAEGAPAGRVVRWARSPIAGLHVGMVLLDPPFFHAGVSGFYTVRTGGAELPIATVSPPVVRNRSLFVNPQRHTYRTRGEVAFPPLTGPLAPPETAT